jgi:PAS domain S-box-containing protein
MGVEDLFEESRRRCVALAEALKLSDQRFHAMADAAPVLIWVADPSRKCTWFNRPWLDFTGRTLEQESGDGWAEGVHPDDLARCLDTFVSSFDARRRFRMEYRLRRHDGEYRWLLDNGAPYTDPAGRFAGFIGSCVDVTEMRQAVDDLRVSREHMEIVLSGAAVGLFYCALPFDRLIWDDRVKEHFHLPPDADVTIQTFYDRMHPDDRDRTRHAIDASVASRQPYDVEYRTVSADGERVKWIRALGRTYYDPAGKPERFDGVTIDVTGRKLAEAERERLLDAERHARAEAERLGRLKDEFLATLSHELRTPLNAILGWSQLLSAGTSTPAEVTEGLKTIERNARVQTQLIEDLLDMSRIINGKIRLDVQRVDVAAVIRAAIASVQPSADAKQLRLQTILDPHAGPVSGDPARLQQVLWNLLTNAIKFTPSGGRVQIVLERVNSHLEIAVSDTGRGIRPEFLPHVFDRFRQADSTTTRHAGGLGIGLSLVKNLTELHGGTVRAKSAGEHQGATFIVSLPLAVLHDPPGGAGDRQHPGSQLQPPASETELPSLAGVRVLVVDDEPDARDLLRHVLQHRKATVLLASGARDALDLVRHERPDVLVSDIGMPDLDGYELIRLVRALPPDQGGRTPAVALTAFARSEDRRRAMLAGFQIHIAKPVEPPELIATVASLAGRTGVAR